MSKTTASRQALSRLHKPADLPLDAWQRELRRQFGREQRFRLENTGHEAVFSDYQVTNPQSKATYRVAIRGAAPGENFCNCPDFATNALGTCKHIEFVLGRLERNRRTRPVLREGFQPRHTEIVLQYGAQRTVRLRAGQDCPRGLTALARKFFDGDGLLRADAFATFESFLSR
ncbi:MAG: SWIM zinc finger domain-containing protein, partial [Vicinamibacterales bacterium]|nr:SWIM zinc finger domain-containing protein [Vicinamibacterales bacterium]